MRLQTAVAASALLSAAPVLACDGCEHPERDVVLTRNVRRMQPDALNAIVQPRGPLPWGQLNVLHTTDTHGWLEGHLKEQNYGADWGDFVSFSKDMKKKAKDLKVDLLLIDTGDLHDGAGLSDATAKLTDGVNGALSNPIFQNIDYDLLTIGNHELYVTEIAYETFAEFPKTYGDRYLTSNVQIYNPSTGAYEYIGATHRYFTTEHGLRIMAFGVLFDFTGNSNASKVIKAADMVKESWFLNALNHTKPIDLFLLIGHNPVRPTDSGNTFKTVFNAIRAVKPDIPIQIFGGHSHIRDFAVYDDKTTALESGRYCETLGWLSMSGIQSSHYHGAVNPRGVPNPTVQAKKVGTSTGYASLASSTSASNLTYSRRYLDWNRLSFEYHAAGSQKKAFDIKKGVSVSQNITAIRKELNLTSLYGCAPQTWCISCAPFLSEGSIFSLLQTALTATVVKEDRAEIPRLIILNTGSVRFDLPEGPFTYDDSFIVSPFADGFQYIPNVPYGVATKVLDALNGGNYPSKRSLTTESFGFTQVNPSLQVEACIDPPVTHDHMHTKRSYPGGRIVRRQSSTATPGYTTTDDFGTDGDDTPHSTIPRYSSPDFFQSNGSLPSNGTLSSDAPIDLIFLDYVADSVIAVLNNNGFAATEDDTSYYMPQSFTTNSYLPAYAQLAASWQANVPGCPVGRGIGYNTTS
ncbi:hypothetical protein AAFC00_006991 [Neodothiora populina]|uniref:Calcineurin-like phosphoesterase n=1 Tax=Neodothiora populina TaxID=2781224 RepID=A0ABR3PBY5_9PEZI